jgi:hypothetical protein
MLSKAMQRTYCRKYLGHPSEDNGNYEFKIKKLSEKFSEMKSKISHEPFLMASNKNPKPDILKKIFRNFGIEDVFLSLNGSVLDEIFSDTGNELEEKIVANRTHLKTEISTFPYKCTADRLELGKSAKPKGIKRTLWQTFLDEINQKRHEVAHGNEFDNGESVKVLDDRKNRVVYLQLGLVELLASTIQKDKS